MALPFHRQHNLATAITEAEVAIPVSSVSFGSF
jgi:hypothetical protein